ncbi:MAG: carbamoyl phosphate synthase large subunit, partial [SAR324 cluster bacterium]|nr:carbamoyl phosphate synthase large subunit [SAR324 cluster bacterium]
KRQAKILALELKVVGLLNVQFAVVQNKDVFILEANPRASRTVPFVSKAMGIPWAKIAARLMVGQTLEELGIKEQKRLPYFAIKACAFTFNRFPGVDILLGPEMKSTGEVMGIHESFAGAFAKAQAATQTLLPTEGTAFISVRDDDKVEDVVRIAQKLLNLGFKLVGTAGTSEFLSSKGINITKINKVREGSPHVVDVLGEGKISLVINTPEEGGTFLDSRSIRIVASELRVPTYTTLAAASAAVQSIETLKENRTLGVRAIQEYHKAFSGEVRL